MGRKHLIYSQKMFDAATLASTQTSVLTDVTQLDKASIHVHWTGTGVSSTITVQARNGDTDPWYTLDISSMVLSGTNGEFQIVLNELPFTAIRLVCTHSAGTGSVTATLTSKSVGA